MGGALQTSGQCQAALKYLAPYIYRVAISNRRLKSIQPRGSLESSQVTFQYRASDTGQLKLCTLSVESFIQRFLQHVLSNGFVKVRYYGFFGAAVRSTLTALQLRLGKSNGAQLEQHQPAHAAEETPARSKILCPQCGQAMRVQRELLPTFCHSP